QRLRRCSRSSECGRRRGSRTVAGSGDETVVAPRQRGRGRGRARIDARTLAARRADLAEGAALGVRLRPRFGLFKVLAADLRTREAGGVLLSYRYTLECLVPGCLPGRTLAER